MIAAKDANGVVHATIPGLSRLANLTLQETEVALRKLEEPDPYSGSTEFEGRRVAKVTGGWLVLNHQKYRDRITELKAYNAMKQAEYRKRKAKALADGYPLKMVKTPQEVEFEKAMGDGEEPQQS